MKIKTNLESKLLVEAINAELIKPINNFVYSVLIFGSIHRDLYLDPNWSDIDLLIVWNNRSDEQMNLFNKAKLSFCKKYSIDIDATHRNINDIITIKGDFNDGMIVNAIKRREVGKYIFGNQIDIDISIEDEEEYAKFYICKALEWQRRCKKKMNKFSKEEMLTLIKRMIKRTFSILRSYLRLKKIYCHPYEDSIYNLKLIYPDYNVEFLYDLIKIRRDYSNYDFKNGFELINRMVSYNRKFVDFTMKCQNITFTL